MAGKVCLSVYRHTCILDTCEYGWGNRLIAVLEPTVPQLSCTHMRANNILLLLCRIGTTGKGCSTTVLYVGWLSCSLRGGELQ